MYIQVFLWAASIPVANIIAGIRFVNTFVEKINGSPVSHTNINGIDTINLIGNSNSTILCLPPN
jgi:hypothetical protein